MRRNEPTQPHPASETQPQKQPGFKWHKCLIYFLLFAAALWNIFMGILHISGQWYYFTSLKANVVMLSDFMYVYYPPLKILDIFFGLSLILMAVYQIIIRFMLAKRKKHAPLHLNIMIGTMCVLSALYDLLFAAFVSNQDFVEACINYSSSASLTLWTAVIIGTGLCIANRYYYKKRFLDLSADRKTI